MINEVMDSTEQIACTLGAVAGEFRAFNPGPPCNYSVDELVLVKGKKQNHRHRNKTSVLWICIRKYSQLTEWAWDRVVKVVMTVKLLHPNPPKMQKAQTKSCYFFILFASACALFQGL